MIVMKFSTSELRRRPEAATKALPCATLSHHQGDLSDTIKGFGIYEYLKSSAPKNKTGRTTFPTLVAIASISGFLGGLAGNPADVLNVRMQHDSALPPRSRRNYRNAIDGLVRMSREEGIASLLKGVWPNSMRAVLMTASQLASYDSIKSFLISNSTLEDNLNTHFLSSIIAGLIATTICSPVDVIKTRLMSATEKESLIRLLSRVYANDGVGVRIVLSAKPTKIEDVMLIIRHKIAENNIMSTVICPMNRNNF